MAFGELDINNLGISKGDVKNPLNVYERYVLELGNAVAQEFINYIEENNIGASGGLKQSVVAIPIGNLQIQIQADDYFKFIDEGVDGTEVSHGSQFKFKYDKPSMAHAKAIQSWIPTRSLTLPPTIPTYKSFAYAIATNVKRKGIKPRNITKNVITSDFLNSIGESILESTGLILSFIFDDTTSQINKI